MIGVSTIGSLFADPAYEGKWVEGEGNAGNLKLIDQAFDSMAVSAEMASLSLFYKRDWDGLVLSNTAWPGCGSKTPTGRRTGWCRSWRNRMPPG